MKRIIFLLLTAVLLCGCAQKEEIKEYTAEEFSEIYADIIIKTSEEKKKLTKEELYGGAITKEEKEKNELAASMECQKKIMKNYGIEFNQRIRVRGKIERIMSPDSEGNPGFQISGLNEKRLAAPIFVHMKDDSLSESAVGDIVVVEGCFKEGYIAWFTDGTAISK